MRISQRFSKGIYLSGAIELERIDRGLSETSFIECGSNLFTVDTMRKHIVATELIFSNTHQTDIFYKENSSREVIWDLKWDDLPTVQNFANGDWELKHNENFLLCSSQSDLNDIEWSSVGYFHYGIQNLTLLALRIEFPAPE
jgi:hypothetical protein